MDPLNPTSAIATALSNLSSFFPALAMHGLALGMVAWMTRHVPPSRERKLAISALALLLASKGVQALSAGLTTCAFASNHVLVYDMRALLASRVLGIYLPFLLESVSVLMVAWAVVKVLRKP